MKGKYCEFSKVFLNFAYNNLILFNHLIWSISVLDYYTYEIFFFY